MRLGVTKTTAADIASAAGISRATLYRRYGSHETIFMAVLERESEAMAIDARAHLTKFEDPAEWLLESMMFSISQIASRPVHAAMFTGESAIWASRRAIRMEEIRSISERGLRWLLREAVDNGVISDQYITDLADWRIRVLMSYASVPGPGDLETADIRRQLRSWFLPAIAPYLGPDLPPLA